MRLKDVGTDRRGTGKSFQTYLTQNDLEEEDEMRAMEELYSKLHPDELGGDGSDGYTEPGGRSRGARGEGDPEYPGDTEKEDCSSELEDQAGKGIGTRVWPPARPWSERIEQVPKFVVIGRIRQGYTG